MARIKKSKLLEVKDNGIVEINIDLKSIDDLLKSNESVASIEENLSKTIEEYLFKAIKCYPINQKVKLLIIINEDLRKRDEEVITKIIHSHFCYKVKETEIYLKEQFRQWRINFFIGMLFLILCLILGEILDKFTHIRIIKIIKESLIIIGWVALWEPVSFILFGWRIIRRDKLYFRKLCDITIKVVEKRFITPV